MPGDFAEFGFDCVLLFVCDLRAGLPTDKSSASNASQFCNSA